MAFGDTQALALDLTLIFDPAEVWPDPETCPDWPIIQQGNPDRFMRGREPAERRLAAHQARIARGAGGLRAPTADEAASLRLEYFIRYDGPVGPWTYELGFPGWGIRDRATEARARTIVDALHVRGYLRKLDERAKRGAIQQERRRQGDARGKIETYERLQASAHDELAGLAEAEARHRQRLADEEAFGRCEELRWKVREAYLAACAGAADLDLEPPAKPTL